MMLLVNTASWGMLPRRHPIRRMLDPFISRSVQSTNENFKLLFVAGFGLLKQSEF